MSRTLIIPLVMLASVAAPARASVMYTLKDYGVVTPDYLQRNGGIGLNASGQVSFTGGIHFDQAGDLTGPPPSTPGPYTFENLPTHHLGDIAPTVTSPDGTSHVVPFLVGPDAPYGSFDHNLFGSAINKTGELIGQVTVAPSIGSSLFNTPGLSQGFYLQFNPSNKDLPTLIPNINGFNQLIPIGLNASGTIVGYSGNPSGVIHAFLFDGHTTFDLNELVPPGAGLTLNSAVQIGDAGQIVGYATDQAGNVHEVELLPNASPVPEPTSLACLLAGSLAVAAMRRTSRGRDRRA